MRGTKTGKETYYQTIAREFFERRGAPFFLSPKDVALIARWEKARVPLDAVLEGMEKAFANYRKGGRSAGALTLAFCEYQVRKAFGRETGKAGRRSAEDRSPGRQEGYGCAEPSNASSEPSRPGSRPCRSPSSAALAILDGPGAGEEGLEALDERSTKRSGGPRPEKEKRASGRTSSRDSPRKRTWTSRTSRGRSW